MSASYCPFCGFSSEKIVIVCPRCRQEMRHEHCRKCGHCTGIEKEDKKNTPKLKPD